MLGFEGFRLLKETATDIEQFDVVNGTVAREPVEKWRVEKTNAFDPTIILRRKKYYEDEIECVAIVLPSELKALLTFLRLEDGEQLYIIYDYDDEQRHYPVTVDKLPKEPDDSRAFRQAVKLSFVALYSEIPSLPDAYNRVELEEGGDWVELEEGGDYLEIEEEGE